MDDQEGFTAFYEACRDELHAAVTLTIGDHQLAVEAVDEALVRAAERWTRVRTFERPVGWVYRVAVNWATSWRRSRLRRPVRPVEELDRPHHDVVPDRDLAELLAGLPLRQRQMLVLRFAFGYSVPQTAAALGVAEGTVKSGVHRARQLLRDRVEVDDAAP